LQCWQYDKIIAVTTVLKATQNSPDMNFQKKSWHICISAVEDIIQNLGVFYLARRSKFNKTMSTVEQRINYFFVFFSNSMLRKNGCCRRHD